MSVQTEQNYPGDLVKYEAPFFYSRETHPVAYSQTLVVGSVCELDTGRMKAVATEANACAICLENVTTPANAYGSAVFLVRHAIVNKAMLGYNSQTASEVDAALKALGILVRAGLTYTNEGVY